MVKNLNEYMVETLHSTAKRSISEKNFNYYMLELEIIKDVKKKFMKDFKEVLKNDKPTSINMWGEKMNITLLFLTLILNILTLYYAYKKRGISLIADIIWLVLVDWYIFINVK